MPGRRKRFDTLLAEHKNRTRERERERDPHPPHSQQNPSLRDPHPSSHLAAAHDAHQVALGNGPAPDATKPLPVSKPKFHSPGLPRYVLLQMLIIFFPPHFECACGEFFWLMFKLPATLYSFFLQTKQQSRRWYPRRPCSSQRVTTPPPDYPRWLFPTLQ